MVAGIINTAGLAALEEIISRWKQNVELWNGTNWTEVNNTTYTFSYAGATGTSTAALALVDGSPARNKTEFLEWN